MAPSSNHHQHSLRLLGLPAFESVNELANNLRYTPSIVSAMWRCPASFYKKYQIPKSSGGQRTILQPNAELKSAQRWILRQVLSKLHVSEACKGFRHGQSVKSNALSHERANCLLQLDLQDFFPSIGSGRVHALFRKVGYSGFAAALLTSLTTVHDGLPQGAPTSPMIANLICHRMDRRLEGLSSKRKTIYTRYADDLTFSSHSPVQLQKMVSVIRVIIQDEGFEVNERKTRFSGLGRRRKVTGLVLNDHGVGVGTEVYRELRMQVFSVTKMCQEDAAIEVSRLSGWLAYLNDVDPLRQKKILRLIRKLCEQNPETTLREILPVRKRKRRT